MTGELSLVPMVGPIGERLCDPCRTEVVEIDREWIHPGRWEVTYYCPDCEREADLPIGTAVVFSGGGAEDIRRDRVRSVTDAYVENHMSVGALERSLDRVYGIERGGDE